MAQNHLVTGEVGPHTLAAAIESGAGILIGVLLGIALQSGGIGDEIQVAYKGVFTLPKTTGGSSAMAQGAKAYWDDTAKTVTGVSAGNTHIGYAYVAAATGDDEADIKLLG